jgi:anti-anti-sigma factor
MLDLPTITDDQFSLVIEMPGTADAPPRIVVSGAVDRTAAKHLQRAVIEVLRRCCPRGVELDVAGVTYLDSAGISALLACQADARQLDCELTLRNTGPATYRQLQIAGLLEHFGLAKPARRTVPGAFGAALGLEGNGLSGLIYP